MNLDQVVPDQARELATQLADTFEQDRGLAEQLNACQDRLRGANGQLWSGLHPDALGLLNDDTSAAAIAEGGSVIAGLASDAIRFQHSVQEAESVLLPALQEVHWTIHRAFCEYQRVSEDRRHLATEIGELIASFVAELVAAGWTEADARSADIRKLASAGAHA